MMITYAVRRRLIICATAIISSGVGPILPNLANAQQAPATVSVTAAEQLLIPISYNTAAVVLSANDSVLAAEVTASVVGIHAEVGQTVSKGDLLISLDPTNFKFQKAQAQANLARTEAEITLATSRLKRSQTLIEKSYVSEDDLGDQTSRVAVLQAQATAEKVAVSIAEEALSDTRIRAPFNGVIVERNAQLGSLLQIGAAAIRITQTDQPEIAIKTNDEALKALEDGNEATFVYRSLSWPAAVVRVSGVVDAQTRLQDVRLKFKAERPPVGQAGRLTWASNARYLPVTYVQRRGQNLGVFVADGGIAKFVVLADAEEGRPALFSLPLSTEIIVNGRERLRDGLKIKREQP